MNTHLIIASEYCHKSKTDPTFLFSLEECGLIEIHCINGEQYLQIAQLNDVEKYRHLHYDLAINIEGLDAIRHLLLRVDKLSQEICLLRRTVAFHQRQNTLLSPKES